MGIEIRPIVEDELDAYLAACHRGFGGEPVEGEAERVRNVIGFERTHAAFDGSRIVGTFAAYGFPLSVPGTDRTGRSVPAAGLTRVTVAATHRRRGILTSMIDAHFADAESRGEPLSVLWASEVAIYGRFGYGQAADTVDLSYDGRLAGIRRPGRPDDVEFVEVDEAREIVPELRERYRHGRPGHYGRSPAWWEHRRLPDPEAFREGAGPRRWVIARRAGRPVGYACFRHLRRWTDDDLPDGEIKVEEVVAVDDEARHTLWWFLSNIDLFPHVKFWTMPTDCVLPWLAADQRAVRRKVSDGLHLRLLDVPGALEARCWDAPGELVFRLRDSHRPDQAGIYRLTASADGTAACEPDDDEPSIDLDVAALGALYLGSRTGVELAAAGLLAGSPASIDRARRLFAWPVAAWCDEVF